MQYQIHIMTFKIPLVQVCSVWGSVFLSPRDTLALLSIAVLGLSLEEGSHCPCRHRALLAGASSHTFPSGADASDCIKHRKGERLIQVVCVKPGLQHLQGLCTEQVWGSSVCLSEGSSPHLSPCAQLPAAALAEALWAPELSLSF